MTKSLLGVFTVVLAASAVISGPRVQLLAEEGGGFTSTPLRGVWQAVEVQLTGPAARTITVPEPRRNLLIVTDRHYCRVVDQAERPRPLLADPATASADELRAVWGPFTGEAGTYELTGGNSITMRPIVAKNPAALAPGAYTTYSLKQNGKTMRITEHHTHKGPFANPATITLVRVE